MEENLKKICQKVMTIHFEQTRHKITNLRLQKLLYFIQVAFLLDYDEVAFTENIEAWPYGPVVPDVYFDYKYGRIEENDSVVLKENLEQTILEIMNLFKDWNDFEIVDLTHEYEVWRTKYESIFGNKIISSNELKEYHLERFHKEGSAF